MSLKMNEKILCLILINFKLTSRKYTTELKDYQEGKLNV